MHRLVRDVLGILGFTDVATAFNGQHALEVMQKKNFDLVISDWRMGVMDGVTFVRKLRQDESSASRYVPVIMLTGNAEQHNVEEARDAGITEFLSKPFTVATLCDRLREVIENPRPFVLSKEYKGPDRRRREKDAPDGVDRRRPR